MSENLFIKYLDIAATRASLPSALDDITDIEIEVTEPKLVVYWGDMHVGAPGCLYEKLEEDVNVLSQAKKDGLNITVIGMGDYIDGYLPTGTPRNPYQVLDPKEQRDMAKAMLDEVVPDYIIEGDHDMWHSNQALQYSWLFEHCMNMNYAYAQWGGKVTFKTLDKDIVNIVRHRYRGSRNSNHVLPQRNAHKELGPADIVTLAHVHSNPGVYPSFSHRRSEGRFLAVQSGTYKYKDEYGKKLADYYGEYGVPSVLINPDGSLLSFDNYKDGLKHLTI